jgi:Phage Mu protein F like protein
MATKQEIREFKRKVDQLIANYGKFEDAKATEMMRILEQVRQNVASAVASTEWDMYHIPQLKEAVNRAIEGLKQRFNADQKTTLRETWDMGVNAIDSPLQYVGVNLALPSLSMAALDILQGYSADLISGLSADALKNINSAITMGVMGGQSVSNVMKTVGRNLDDPSIFKTIAGRAEAITRTEMGHVHAAARQARAEQTVEANPETAWDKQWISSGKAHPRPHHAALDGVTIPVDDLFLGYIPYPHAPGLPASEVVNCG